MGRHPTYGRLPGPVVMIGFGSIGRGQANAYWYGSRLSIEKTRSLGPYQNATGLQVTSAVLAAMVWAFEHPRAGIVEADDMDFRRCLEIQRPYLGPVEGHFTDWTPLSARSPLFSEDIDETDPWQFRNVMVH
jgi:homospermidine synthase